MDLNELRQRLRRAGVQSANELAKPLPTGNTARPVPPVAAQPDIAPAAPSAQSTPQEQNTPHGSVYFIETRFPLPFSHGKGHLQSILNTSPTTFGKLSRNSAEISLQRLAFLDTETTGLAGGAGTLAFMVGVGLFETAAGQTQPHSYRLVQFFLRKPGEERAMLSALAELLADCEGIVTYNGQTFDLPLLTGRFTLARKPSPFTRLTHLDLLSPARRLWRNRASNCSLSTLEREILWVQRTGEDVPGWLIPQLYVQYLQTGDTSQMERVLYHNRLDILSMTALSGQVMQMFGDPTDGHLSGEDCLRLAGWLSGQGEAAQAETAFRAALDRPMPQPAYIAALQAFADFLKQNNRRGEAVAYWELWAAYEPLNALPFVELAKFYEWHQPDYAQALVWCHCGIAGVGKWADDWRKQETLAQFTHRAERLKGKLG
jgi:uncharacterized protein YprB with RNaseH-like and TPR domain